MPDLPAYPPSAMTTYELRDRKSELEHAITASPPGATSQTALRHQLAAVIAEQDERARIRRTRNPSQ
jgi:hypothetical protein